MSADPSEQSWHHGYSEGLRHGKKWAHEYIDIAGQLAAIVEWCVKHDGETLFDNPHVLTKAKEVLAAARRMR